MDHTKTAEILDLRAQVARLRQEFADMERRAERAERKVKADTDRAEGG